MDFLHLFLSSSARRAGQLEAEHWAEQSPGAAGTAAAFRSSPAALGAGWALAHLGLFSTGTATTRSDSDSPSAGSDAERRSLAEREAGFQTPRTNRALPAPHPAVSTSRSPPGASSLQRGAWKRRRKRRRRRRWGGGGEGRKEARKLPGGLRDFCHAPSAAVVAAKGRARSAGGGSAPRWRQPQFLLQLPHLRSPATPCGRRASAAAAS